MVENVYTPVVLSLLICDQIIIDRLTGKASLIGLFSNIAAARFPVRHPQLCVFAALNEGRGQTPIEIRIIDLNEQRPPIVTGSTVVEFQDPLSIAYFNLHFNGLVFPEAGEYRVQLLTGGQLMREARLHLKQVQPR